MGSNTRSVYNRRLNKCLTSEFSEAYLNRYTPKEDRSCRTTEACEYKNKDEDNSRKVKYLNNDICIL